MKVEIWSDVMCPFCYIGKRRFEAALSQFEFREDVEIEWKSFQLNPDLVTDPTKSTLAHLSESKGWTVEETRERMDYVIEMAKEAGLQYDFDKAIVANSFDAHRLIQFSKAYNKTDVVEEQLFKAYFEEGKNTADVKVLQQIGLAAGLPPEGLENLLGSRAFSEEVLKDVEESQRIGLRGVPFFVFDRQYAVSGAQGEQVFLKALNKTQGLST